MLKATNIQISSLFTKESNWEEVFINYQIVIIFFKEYMTKIRSNAFLRESIYR